MKRMTEFSDIQRVCNEHCLEFEADKDGITYHISADKEYAEAESVGKFLNDTGSEKTAEAAICEKLISYVENTKDGDNIILFEKRKINHCEVVYKIELKNKCPLVYISVNKVDIFSCTSKIGNMAGERAEATFLFDVSGDCVEPKCCDSNAQCLLPFFGVNGSDDAEFENDFSAGIVPMLKRCVQNKNIINYFDSIVLDGKRKVVFVMLKPLLHGKCTSVLVELYDVNYKDKYAGIRLVDVISENVTAVGSVILSPDGKAFFKEINLSLLTMIEEDRISLEDIVNTKLFSAVFSLRHSVCGAMVHISADNKSCKFVLRCIPLIKDNEIEQVIVSVMCVNAWFSEKNEKLKGLTSREKEIIELVAVGMTNKYIASRLCISEGTVKKSIYNCYKKLHVASRFDVIRMLGFEL